MQKILYQLVYLTGIIPTVPLLTALHNMMNTSKFQSLLISQNPLINRSLTPELQYPPSPISFMASSELLIQIESSSVNPSIPAEDILSCPPSPCLPLQNFNIMELQVEVHHPLPCHTSPDQLCALVNLGGRQLEAMRRELIRYPDGRLHEIFLWDCDCLVRAVLHQTGAAPFHLSIIEDDEYFITTFRDQPHLLPLQQQHKETMQIEITPQHLCLMNLKKVYLQLQMPLLMKMVYLAEA